MGGPGLEGPRHRTLQVLTQVVNREVGLPYPAPLAGSRASGSPTEAFAGSVRMWGPVPEPILVP
jgi:hypothetical protein